MSEPSQHSDRSFSLVGSHGVEIRSGHVDLFVTGDSGRRWPLLSVEGPLFLVGVASGTTAIIGEARAGAEIVAHAARPAETDFSPLIRALNASHHLKTPLTASHSEADLVAALTTMASSELLRQTSIQSDLFESATKVDARLEGLTTARLRDDVHNPAKAGGHASRFPSAFDEVNILRLVGEAGGFTVQEPRALADRGVKAVVSIARNSGLRVQPVHLGSGWTSRATSPLVGFIKDADGSTTPVALLPRKRRMYYQSASDSSRHRVIEGKTPLSVQGLMVYSGFPLGRKATFLDMGRLAVRGSGSTLMLILGCSLLVALLGLATPIFTSSVLGVFVPQGNIVNTVGIGIALTVLALSAGAFVVVQNFATSRLTQVAQMRVEAAIWDRTLRLPLKFFREYSSGALAYRIIAVDSLKQLLSSQTVTSILAAVFSLVNFILLFRYSAPLAWASLVIFVVTIVFMMWLTRRMSSLIRTANDSQQEASAWFVQLVGGISKIRVAGAEMRFTDISILKQADQITNQAAQTVLSGRLQTYLALIGSLSSIAFLMIIGVLTWDDGPTITAATYIAFSTAFGSVLGAIVGVSSAVPAIAAAKPVLSLVSPILDAVQEQDLEAEFLTHIRGDYEFRRVSFRYLEELPLVLQDFSCTIKAGATTAIVGPSGSGKTTALRLLSALEYPESGQLLIDGHDIKSIIPASIRSRLGVVVQGGQVANGSILDNIGGGAEIPEDIAWIVAEQANIADDINAMPMKMHTIISPQTLSGGQAQRLLIARAIARSPDVLLLDEATSALDNVSQALVTRALASMPGTKVVVAQRLSTLENADHILVMDRGALREQGTFDELMSANGLFADLAKRQLASN